MKKNIIFLILFIAFMLIFGCSKTESHFSQSESVNAQTMGRDAYDGMEMPKAAPMTLRDASDVYDRLRDEEAASEAANFNIAERKLIKWANVRIRVENLDAADISITDLMRKHNAYAASTEINENSRIYSLRVPAPLYDVFLDEMNGMGRLIHRSENTEDVTLRYYDLEGRLATKKELLKTYQSYLGRAKNIEEVLSVEARIADLQSDIEGTGMQLRNLANRVDYATIELSLFGPVTSNPDKRNTFGERFAESFGGFGYFLSSILFVIIGIVIYGIPILSIVALLFLLLFGRIGLLKKLWQFVTVKKQG